MWKKLFFLIIFTMFVSASVFAQTEINSINGKIVDQMVIDLSGRGFGSNTLAIEWLGEHIESGTADSDVSLPAGWTAQETSSAAQKPVYSTTRAYSGSKSIKSSWPSVDQYSSAFSYDMGSGQDSVYVSYWVYFNHAGSEAGQWKKLRIRPNSSVTDIAGEIMFSTWYQSNGSLSQEYFASLCASGNPVENQCYVTSASDRWINSPDQLESGQWVRVEVYAAENSISGRSDGTLVYTLHKGSSIISVKRYVGNLNTRDVGINDKWRYIIFQNYWGNISSGNGTQSSVYIDDIFIQKGSQARVEIGNASTWSACTHREIQIPVEWSDTSIKLKLNKGSFGSEKLYMFVVDHLGNVNADGREIRFDSTGIGSTTLRIE